MTGGTGPEPAAPLSPEARNVRGAALILAGVEEHRTGCAACAAALPRVCPAAHRIVRAARALDAECMERPGGIRWVWVLSC